MRQESEPRADNLIDLQPSGRWLVRWGSVVNQRFGLEVSGPFLGHCVSFIDFSAVCPLVSYHNDFLALRRPQATPTPQSGAPRGAQSVGNPLRG